MHIYTQGFLHPCSIKEGDSQRQQRSRFLQLQHRVFALWPKIGDCTIQQGLEQRLGMDTHPRIAICRANLGLSQNGLQVSKVLRRPRKEVGMVLVYHKPQQKDG